jgi:hypothetical protein
MEYEKDSPLFILLSGGGLSLCRFGAFLLFGVLPGLA